MAENQTPLAEEKDPKAELLAIQDEQAAIVAENAQKQRDLEASKVAALAKVSRQIRQEAEYRTLVLDAALSKVLNPELTAAASVTQKGTVKVTVEVTDSAILDAVNTQLSGAFVDFKAYEALKVELNVNQLFIGRNSGDSLVLQAIASLARQLRTEENQYLQNVAQDAGVELPTCLR